MLNLQIYFRNLRVGSYILVGRMSDAVMMYVLYDQPAAGFEQRNYLNAIFPTS